MYSTIHNQDQFSKSSFLELSYLELEERNLELKRDRASNKNENDFKKKVITSLENEKGIKAVMLCLTDLEGRFLNLDYDKKFFIENYENLTFDGSSVRGFSNQNKSDLRLVVDWSSLRWIPSEIFGAGKVLMFANICKQDGTFHESDFRFKLKELSKEMLKNNNSTINIAPEVEGFLFDGVDVEQNFAYNPEFKLVTIGGYFNSLPQDKLKKFIDKVAEIKRVMGFENEKDHPEVAPSQFELNYKYTNALDAADQIQLYKLICRQIAKLMNCTASFLPKPINGINGSGMHINISISQSGKNIFYDKNNAISEFGTKFATGILYHAKEICLILNSSVNAYRRLDPKFEAPNEIKLSSIDRSAMIRIPIGNENSARIEVRSVAPDCNPYLAIFSLVKVGLNGIEDKSKKMEQILKKREKLPSNINDAIRYFKNSETIEIIMHSDCYEKFVSLKEEVADRSPKDLGKKIKIDEIIYHHEITNQLLWYDF
ncbi:MAG: hypothetical protein RL208_680 [Pseudomonadota bacterium]|jgi:glutamine synthetase